jgi:hypothetical protein
LLREKLRTTVIDFHECVVHGCEWHAIHVLDLAALFRCTRSPQTGSQEEGYGGGEDDISSEGWYQTRLEATPVWEINENWQDQSASMKVEC